MLHNTSPNTALQEARGLHKRKSRHRREPTTPKRIIEGSRKMGSNWASMLVKAQTYQAEAPLPLDGPRPRRGAESQVPEREALLEA